MTETRTIALITGASRGIGHEVARQLAALGIVVLAAVRDPGTAAGSLASLPGDVRSIRLDVTDEAAIHSAAATVAADYGRLDILINNAGGSGNSRLRPILHSHACWLWIAAAVPEGCPSAWLIDARPNTGSTGTHILFFELKN
jgi:NAD(P)-dependent dehydrogenase (short-subunit alcohol dehydrogenase family)